MGLSDDKSPLQSVQELLPVIKAGLDAAGSWQVLLSGAELGLTAAAVRQSHNVRPVLLAELTIPVFE